MIKLNSLSLKYTELWAPIDKQHWQWPWIAHAPVSCRAYVKTDFGVWGLWSASVFIFTRERGHSTPLSIFSALTQTDRDRVKGKTGEERFWLGYIWTIYFTGSVIRWRCWMLEVFFLCTRKYCVCLSVNVCKLYVNEAITTQ